MNVCIWIKYFSISKEFDIVQMTNNMNIYHFLFIGSWFLEVFCFLHLVYRGLQHMQHALVSEGMLQGCKVPSELSCLPGRWVRRSGDQRKHKTYPLLKLENPSRESSGDIASTSQPPRPVARRSGDTEDLGDDDQDDDDHADNFPPDHGTRTCRY